MPTINPQAVRGPVTAVPVVAGTGVRFVEDVPNNRVVVELDETVLWESTDNAGHQTVTLSESKNNFERIKILYAKGGNNKQYPQWFEVPGYCDDFNIVRGKGAANVWISWARLVFTNATTLTITVSKAFNFGSQTATTWQNPSVSVDNNEDIASLWKVVGINRISASA